MRRYLLYILLIFLSACETERILFEGPYFIRFTEVAQTVKESYGKNIRVEIHYAGPILSEDIKVAYSISGNAREGIDFQIVETKGQATIKAGQRFGYITVRLINNANNILRAQDVIFTLGGVTPGNLEMGQGSGGIGRKFTLSILDDCILGGTYNGNRSAFSISTKNISITSSDCENYLLSNWDVDIFGAADPVPLNFIDNGDNSLTIPAQDVEVFFGFNTIDISVEGVGSVNPITREIFMSLDFDDSGDMYSVSITFKPE